MTRDPIDDLTDEQLAAVTKSPASAVGYAFAHAWHRAEREREEQRRAAYLAGQSARDRARVRELYAAAGRPVPEWAR